MPLRLSGWNHLSLYLVMYLPSLSPISRSLYSAQRSIRPLEDGVPVSPITLRTVGRTFISALNLAEVWFLKDESSSSTRQS